MKFGLKFLLACTLLLIGSNVQLNAHSNYEHYSQITSKNFSNSSTLSAQTSENVLSSFNVSSLPTKQKKGSRTKDVAEIEEVEEESESNSSKRYFEDIQYFTSLFYAQLLKQFFLCSNNLLSLVKLCSYISPEHHYLLFQVFRI